MSNMSTRTTMKDRVPEYMLYASAAILPFTIKIPLDIQTDE